MKESFSIALKYFKYLLVVFCLIFWVAVVIHDWGLIQKYWFSHWYNYLALWGAYGLVYTLGLSLFYWGIASGAIVVYHKLIKK